MRPCASVAGTRCTRCTPLSGRPGVGSFAGDLYDDLFVAADSRIMKTEDIGLPPLGFGIARVHAVQVRREQAGLIASRAGADLHDHVPLVVGIAGQQHPSHLGVAGLLLRLEAGDLLLGQLAHLQVLFRVQELARVLQFLGRGHVAPIDIDQRRDLGLLLGDLDSLT